MHALFRHGLGHSTPQPQNISSLTLKKRLTSAQATLFTLLSLFSVGAFSTELTPSSVTDGPYVFLDQGNQNTAYWICQSQLNKPLSQTINWLAQMIVATCHSPNAIPMLPKLKLIPTLMQAR